ncbi:MAG: MATE family efflux transporter [Bacteroidetes bacterium]|nr:MATE family efflux transporter [Bacteroidota bacterium]
MNIFNDFKTDKYILKLALPAIAGLSTQMIVSLVDTAMVGRLPNAEFYLAAMGLGVLATWAIISFFSSLATGTHVLIARGFGQKNYEHCGEVLNTSIIIGMVLGVVVSLLVVTNAYLISDFFAADDQVGIYAGDYLYYRFMGIPFFLITVSYRGFFFGIGKTKIFMISGILVNFLNITFNYMFIFGAFGYEGMGLAGAGLGSTIATICDAIFYLVVSSFVQYRSRYHYFKSFRFNREIAEKILRISLPVSFQNVFILVGFLSFVAITGLIGTLEQAASQIVISALMISFMPCNGFGIAIQTLVGNSLGEKNVLKAKHFGYVTSKLATYYTTIVAIIFLIAPQFILVLVTNDSDVIEAATPALRIVGFGQVFYAVGIVLSNGLQAAGRTFFVMMAEVLVNWVVFVPLAYLLGVVLGYGLEGAWAALPFYVILYSVIIFVKFKSDKMNTLKN